MHTWWAEEAIPNINPFGKSALLIDSAFSIFMRTKVREKTISLMMVVDVKWIFGG